MAIKFKNIDVNPHNWGGKYFEPGELHTTESMDEAKRFGFDDTFLYDFGEGLAEVYDGDIKFTSCAKTVYLLQNGKIFTPTDEEDKPYFRQSMTKLSNHYAPKSLDFYAGKLGSLYNRKDDGAGIDDGTDYGDADIRFYERDEYGEAIEMVQSYEELDEEFQARLSQYCVKTVVNFESTKNLDIWGAKFMISRAPTSRAYLWVIAVPDFPEEYGGSVPFMGGGMNLQITPAKTPVYFDAKTSKELVYNAEYHTNKIAIVIKHAPGEDLGVQLIFDYYEE